MKEKVLRALRDEDDYVSGQALCEKLGVSRTAVWKSIQSLREDGYVIEAVHDCLKKGIRNHPYTCFRSTKGKVTGSDAVQIGNGGNWYFVS